MELALRLRPKNQDNYALPFKVKKNLSLLSLIDTLSQSFQAIPDERQQRRCQYDLHDVMMGALSCMFFQEPSWLQYQQRLQYQYQQNNLFTLFNMTNIPKESQLRDILNKVDSEHYRRIFTSLLDKLRRDKHLASYRLPLTHQGLYYVAVDGSQWQSI
jgi:hypothetical protein